MYRRGGRWNSHSDVEVQPRAIINHQANEKAPRVRTLAAPLEERSGLSARSHGAAASGNRLAHCGYDRYRVAADRVGPSCPSRHDASPECDKNGVN